MYKDLKELQFPEVGQTYISKKLHNKYQKVKVLENKEEIYKSSSGSSLLNLVIIKVLEPIHFRGNIDIEITDEFHDKYVLK